MVHGVLYFTSNCIDFEGSVSRYIIKRFFHLSKATKYRIHLMRELTIFTTNVAHYCSEIASLYYSDDSRINSHRNTCSSHPPKCLHMGMYYMYITSVWKFVTHVCTPWSCHVIAIWLQNSVRA